MSALRPDSITDIVKLNDLNTHEPSRFVQLPSGDLVSKVSVANTHLVNQFVDILPFSGLSSQIFQTQQAQVTFNVTPGIDIDLTERFYLKMVLANADAVNAIRIVPPQFLIQRIEWYFNDQLAQTQYGVQLWTDWNLFSRYVTILRESNLLGINPDTLVPITGANPNSGAATATISASGTQTYFVPLKAFMGNVSMPLGLMQGKVNVRCQIYFDAGNKLLDTGSAGAMSSISLSQCSLRILGSNFRKDEDRQAEIIDMKNHRHIYRYMYEALFPITATGISNNGSTTPYTQTLNISGRMAALAVYAQTQSPTGSSLYIPQELASFQFQDASGNSLLGSNIQIEDEFARYAFNSGELDSESTTPLPIYLAAWSNNIKATYDSAINLGELQVEPSYRLQYLPVVGTSGANWTLNILAWQYAALIIDPDGKIILTR